MGARLNRAGARPAARHGAFLSLFGLAALFAAVRYIVSAVSTAPAPTRGPSRSRTRGEHSVSGPAVRVAPYERVRLRVPAEAPASFLVGAHAGVQAPARPAAAPARPAVPVAPARPAVPAAPPVSVAPMVSVAAPVIASSVAELEAIPVVAPRTRTDVRTDVRSRTWALTIVAVAALGLVLRLLNHSTNYDVFIDEITYATIGNAVALGHGVSLYTTPFFLHPPAFFYLEGAFLHIFGGTKDATVGLVLALRPLNCAIGSIQIVLMMVLAARWLNRPAAIAIGIFMAVDPFLLLWDGRVLLETMAMTAAVGGWICIDALARRHDAGQISGRAERALVIGGGLLIGLSLLTKETYAFVGIVPLFAMLVIGGPVRRRATAGTLAVAFGCYALFMVGVLVDGHVDQWWTQQFAGFSRALGTKQITGFNQSGGHASLGSRLGADLSLYLITYLVIAATGLAALVGAISWFRLHRAGRVVEVQRRLAILLGAGGTAYVGYAVMFGAFEVQIFYMSLVAGLPLLAMEISARRSRMTHRVGRRTLLVAGVTIASLALVYDLAVDVHVRATKDQDYPALVSYIAQHVPAGSLVDSTDQVSAFVMTGVRIDGPRTVAGIERQQPAYIVVDQKLVDDGYVQVGTDFEGWLKQHAHVVFSTKGRSGGQMKLYKTVYATGVGQ